MKTRTGMWTRRRTRRSIRSRSKRTRTRRSNSSSRRRTRTRTRRRTWINCIFIFKFSFLFTFICSGNFQFISELDPDPHLSMRISIQEASDYADPFGSGSVTLL